MKSPVVDEFLRISRVPRQSGNEAGLREYLIGCAESLGLEWKRDDPGNLAVFLPPTPGMEKFPGIILQGHMDMVCVADGHRDFEREGIRVVESGGWLSAEGTSLGADNGIGCAMALCAARESAHGPLSLLFTVEEEVGLRGMSALSPDLLDPRASYAVNLDFESEAHICIGCAGGLVVNAHAVLPPEAMQTEPMRAGEFPVWKARARGAQGGHSGLDIDGRPTNLHRWLVNALDGLGARILSYEGGDAVNSIPTRADATFTIPPQDDSRIKATLERVTTLFAREYAYYGGKPSLEFDLEVARHPMVGPSRQGTADLARAIAALPDGVVSRHEGLGSVRSSSSLGILRLAADGKLQVGMTARSDNLAEAAALKARILTALESLPGARMELDEFPSWQPDGDTPLVAYVQERRRGIFATPAELISVHAGIECGGLASKRPGLGVVSIGPDIAEVHTTRERASVDSIDRVYSWLKAILSYADELGTTKGCAGE